MGKIILRNKLTNEIIELEGKVISPPEGWELVKCKKEKNGSVKKNANGDGSFYFSETLQKWVGQIQPPNGGKRITVTQRKNETKTECKNRYNDIKTKINSGAYVEKTKDTLYIILKRNIEQKYKDGITSPRSYQRNLETLKQIEVTCKDFIHKPIQKVIVENIEDAKPLIREYAPSTIDKIWGMLKIGFRIANSRRKIVFNIMDDDTLLKPISLKTTKIVPSLNPKEEKKLRDILNNEEKDHPYRDIALLQLNTGMRIGEVLARSANDFDKKRFTLNIWNTLTQDKKYKVILGKHTKIYDKKNNIDKGKRIIPLEKESIEILSRRTKGKIKNIYNLLFWDYENNCFITPNEVNCWIKRLNEKYKITDKDLTTHVLRHTRITRMQEAGIQLAVTQYYVGHVEGSKMTNNVYTSVTMDFINNEIKKMN